MLKLILYNRGWCFRSYFSKYATSKEKGISGCPGMVFAASVTSQMLFPPVKSESLDPIRRRKGG